MSEELKPCPFCGGEGVLEHSFHEDGHRAPRDFWHVRVGCESCDFALPWIEYGNQDQRVANFHVKGRAEAEAIAAWNTRPAPKADSALVGELREKAEQADAAKRNLHGLPVLAMESDTHKGKLALWCDNGLAGVGQTCVAVNLGEFPDEQIKAIAALANIAATTDFATILAALFDRDVVLEGLLREARAWVFIAEHDEHCELHPDYGEQNLEAANEEAEQKALERGGDERDVRYRTHPEDAVCTCERGEILARIDAALKGGVDE